MLAVEKLSAWYGEARVLRDVSLTVAQGEIVTLVGRNGAGKTTLLRSITGLHKSCTGRIEFDGDASFHTRPAHRRARAGLGYVPDDRGVYANLSVAENLLLPPVIGTEAWSLDEVYDAFPVLKERRRFRGTDLSGGEQQMLAIARVLRMGARLLLLDEPTEGLAPLLVARIGDILRRIKAAGGTVLLIEQNLHFATTVADRHYLLAEGRVAQTLDNDQVRERDRELLAYLGI